MHNNTTSESLKLALSSLNIEERLDQLQKIWNDVKDEEVLFQCAKLDEVSSHLGWLLKQSNLKYSNYWTLEVEKVESRVTVLMDILEEIAQKLSEHKIGIVALKNAGITKGIYTVLACSPMGDLDILVSSKDFYEAHHIIINELGFTFKFRSKFETEVLEEAFRGGGTEYFKKVKDFTVWLELQWRPIAGRWIQPHNEPDGDELMQRSIPVDGSSVRILAPEDNLLQVALHTAKHSYVRAPGFRLHSDVDRIVRYQSINWDSFTENVKKLKLKTTVYFSLFFACGYLFYGAFFAALGAVSGSESDGQQFLIPLILILCFALYAGYFALENPDSPWTTFLMYFPFTAPVVAMVKLAGGFADGDAYQLFVSLFLLLTSSVGVIAIAARLFKNGLLQFGHTLRLKNIILWLKVK